MKKAIFLLLTGLFMIATSPAYAQFAGGEGTEDNPYQIANLDQLQEAGNDLEAHYILTADIEASNSKDWHEGDGFVPIAGGRGESFEGSFDGNGFKIKNLFIFRVKEHRVGLFGSVSGLLKNIALENNLIMSGSDYTGGLAGQLLSGGEIRNSSSTGEVRGGRPTGGLVGLNTGKIIDSHSSALVEGSRDVGGLVGLNDDGGIIMNSYATGNVSTTYRDGHDAGGLVGKNDGGSEIHNSFASGDVSILEDARRAGGLVGQHMGDGSVITNSYARGSVMGGDRFTGGFVGRSRENVTISGSYSTGTTDAVSGRGILTTGGFAGESSDGSEIVDSYWDAESSENDRAVGEGETDYDITGLTTDQMIGQAAYENMTALDFQDVWMLTEEYPALRWEDVDSIPISSEPVTELPDHFSLKQNYPNPFNPATKIGFELPVASEVRLEVYDLQGRRLSVLASGEYQPGHYEVNFDAGRLASGIYLYRLTVDGITETRQMILAK